MSNADIAIAPEKGISEATQTKEVLAALRRHPGEPVSARGILIGLGIARVAARIFDLRQQGHNIVTIRNGVGRMASYQLLDPEAQKDQEAADRWLARPIR